MKKRIFGILLCLCMVLALFPVTSFAETPGSLAITVYGFQVGKTPNDCTYTFESTITGITFSKDDIQYIRWDKYAADGDLYPVTNDDAFRAGTRYKCFIDLGSKGLTEVPVVTVNGNTPDYCSLTYFAGVPEKLSIGCDLGTPTEPGSLAIKVDGFKAGNTPKDITLSFASTNLGVTFSADDILRCSWDQYIVGGMGYDWYTMSRGEVFQAGTRYKCFIDLGNNGLTEAPVVTVNGNTPEYCEIATRDGVPYALLIECELGTPPERSQYTITYEGGEGVEGSIPAGVKARGEAFTLSSETFVRDGFIQSGWIDKETGAIYELGATYDEDRDVTLYPYWEKLITLTAPFTTTVKLGGNVAPGETTFDLEIVGNNAGGAEISDVTVTGSVTTNGAGDYEGELTLTGPSRQLENMLCNGAFVKQVDGGEESWTYDDTVYGLLLSQGVAELATDDSAPKYTVLVLPVICNEADDGVYYDLDLNAEPLDEMSFTNTYTESINDPTENNPTTGDNSNPALWFALLAISAFVLIGTGVYGKRRSSAK